MVWVVCVVDCIISCWRRASFVILLLYFLFNLCYLKLKRPEKWFAGAILASEAPEVGNLLFELLGKLRLTKCAFHDFRLFRVFFEPFLLITDFLLRLNLQEFRLWAWWHLGTHPWIVSAQWLQVASKKGLEYLPSFNNFWG